MTSIPLALLEDEEMPDPATLQRVRRDIDDGLMSRGLDEIAATSLAKAGAGLADLTLEGVECLRRALALPWDEAWQARTSMAACGIIFGTVTKIEGDRMKARQNDHRERLLRIVEEERERIRIVEAKLVHVEPLPVAPGEPLPRSDDPD